MPRETGVAEYSLTVTAALAGRGRTGRGPIWISRGSLR